ncbi:Aspartyl/Asparaginyl beta-hydroxylase [seawater metagenome]|uniref:Aspartyl/Asparaginyl beta-hydroxylase n=1 Tax=seawater metagenome TaxID=1561972 RepID=A0A5E8CKJ0_9ZZZZ
MVSKIFIIIILIVIAFLLWPKSEFRWRKPLTQNYELIQKECKKVMDKILDYNGNHYRIVNNQTTKLSNNNRPKYWDDINLKDIENKWIRGPESIKDEWKNYGLWINGKPIIENCKKCPITYMSIKKAIQYGIKIKVAGFSWLKPNSKIPPHTDPNDEEVHHFGIIVPNTNDCFIICDNKKYIHKSGEWITFDDRKLHSAINNSKQDRIILYMLIEK